MKKSSYYFRFIPLFVILVLELNSCSLDEIPVTFRTTKYYYENKDECEVAVKGAYAAAQWIYSKNFFEMVELPTDYARTTKTTEQKHTDLALYSWTPTHSSIYGFYSDAFSAINRFNSVINNIGDVNFLSESDQKRMIAEVRFLRGLHYFNLVRVFGEMPVTLDETTNSEQTSFPKWKNEDIFKKVILPDLEYAETNLPFDAYEAHRASGVAAKALLAKVYLWLASCGENKVLYHDWVSTEDLVNEYNDSVKSKCEAILQDSKYGLYNKFYDVWSIANKVSKDGVIEHIFSINFVDDNNEGNPYGAYFSNYYSNAPGWDLTPGREPVLLGQGFSVMSPTKEFWLEINSNPYDKRDTTMFVLRTGTTSIKDNFVTAGGTTNSKDITGTAANLNSGVNFGIVKYRKQDGLETDSKGSCIMPVLRYSDVLLMYAEACGYGDPNGLEALNRVRRRAYENSSYSATFADFNNATDYKMAILNERKIELCFEMDRWFDLVRTGLLGEVINNLTMSFNTSGGVQIIKMADYFDDPVKRSFFPLPSRALELNKSLEQNSPWKN